MDKFASDDELCRRAIAAYFRTAVGGSDGVFIDTPGWGTDVTEHDGKRYVVTQDSRGTTVAVYRVQNDGALRRMKRWPREVAPRS
jgi:hypothetical protein